MSKIEYLIWQYDTSFNDVYTLTPRYIHTSPKRKLRNNTDVVD